MGHRAGWLNFLLTILPPLNLNPITNPSPLINTPRHILILTRFIRRHPINRSSITSHPRWIIITRIISHLIFLTRRRTGWVVCSSVTHILSSKLFPFSIVVISPWWCFVPDDPWWIVACNRLSGNLSSRWTDLCPHIGLLRSIGVSFFTVHHDTIHLYLLISLQTQCVVYNRSFRTFSTDIVSLCWGVCFYSWWRIILATSSVALINIIGGGGCCRLARGGRSAEAELSVWCANTLHWRWRILDNIFLRFDFLRLVYLFFLDNPTRRLISTTLIRPPTNSSMPTASINNPMTFNSLCTLNIMCLRLLVDMVDNYPLIFLLKWR